MTDYQDIIIECTDCGEEFVFSAGEQSFYAEKEFENPRRCTNCRRVRKEKRNNYESNYE